MPADENHATPLAAAARRRHELTRSKAIRAVRELDRAGAVVTFEAVARHAEVSRSWLYTQTDLRAEIEQLREATPRGAAHTVPATQRASNDSLLRRLQQANERNRLLAEENKRLRRQLEHALGEQRAARDSPGPAADPAAHRRGSVTIGPR